VEVFRKGSNSPLSLAFFSFKNITDSEPLELTFDSPPLEQEGKTFEIVITLRDNPLNAESMASESKI